MNLLIFKSAFKPQLYNPQSTIPQLFFLLNSIFDILHDMLNITVQSFNLYLCQNCFSGYFHSGVHFKCEGSRYGWVNELCP